MRWTLASILISSVAAVYFRSNTAMIFFLATIILAAFIVDSSKKFEEKKITARQSVIIGVMTSVAVIGRCAFFMLPQIKPTAAVTIIAGASLGKENGFIVGAMSMFISNCIFGHGPWTLWQMIAMGAVGYLAGMIFHGRDRPLVWVVIYGFLSVFFIYGILADFSGILMLGDLTVEGIAALYVSAIPFNIIHGVSTGAFLIVGYEFIIKKMDRIQRKYEIFEQ